MSLSIIFQQFKKRKLPRTNYIPREKSISRKGRRKVISQVELARPEAKLLNDTIVVRRVEKVSFDVTAKIHLEPETVLDEEAPKENQALYISI